MMKPLGKSNFAAEKPSPVKSTDKVMGTVPEETEAPSRNVSVRRKINTKSLRRAAEPMK